jgi:hypothetical protein
MRAALLLVSDIRFLFSPVVRRGSFFFSFRAPLSWLKIFFVTGHGLLQNPICSAIKDRRYRFKASNNDGLNLRLLTVSKRIN